MIRSHSRIRIKNWDALGQPITLFASGEQGVWYDPFDLSTLFQDAAFTLPVTGVEQPVGGMLDKSGRGNHASQPTAASRPILSALVNRYIGTATLATQNITTLATTYTLSFTGAGSITLSGTATGTFAAGTHSVVTTAGTLTSTVSGTVTNADIRVTNEAIGSPSYQRVTTSTDYDTAGFPLYLRFDGVDDWLSTASIDFTGTDKMSVFAGVRKLSDAARGMIVEFSGVSGNFSLDNFIGSPAYRFFSTGNAAFNDNQTALTMGYPAPITSVVSGAGNISGDSTKIRVDGQLKAQGVGDQGTGNYGNHILYIGRRSGTTLPFNGHLYGLIIRGALTDDPTTVKVEKLLAGKTGVQF